jgi:hypothetical protein
MRGVRRRKGAVRQQRLMGREGALLLLVAIILLAYIIRIVPYLVGDPHFEVGFDTGYYEWYLSSYMGGNWSGLPAYPAGLDHPSGRLFEPGLFVTLSAATALDQGSIGEAFRFHLPLLVSILIGMVGFLISRRLTGSDVGGLLGALLFSISYLQVAMVTESYYKQTFATFLLLASLYYLDLYLEGGEPRRLVPFIVLFAGTSFYHLPMTFIGLLGIAAVLAIRGWGRDLRSIRDVSVSLLASGVLAMPGWLPRVDTIWALTRSTVTKSAWRTSTLVSGEGTWEQGGAIPQILWEYDHIIVGYIVVFLPLVILSVIAYHGLKVRGSLARSIPMLSMVIWVYASLWLFFGNRFVFALDLLLCLIAPVSLLFFLRLPKKGWTRLAVGLVIVLAFVPLTVNVVEYQVEAEPYITDNIEGVEWMVENIGTGAIIFAPDYLSANLIQEGWTMAIWDPYLSEEGNPLYAAEEFMVEAPSNGTYLKEFFEDHPEYRDRELIVLWGEWDLDRSLISNGELIPFEEYAESQWFEEIYRGADEIYLIYKFSSLP